MNDPASPLLRLISRTVESDRDKQLTDGQLLTLFLTERDEGAFQILVGRHGPMVLDVCRNAVGNETDAEDAFQATFLILAQKAAAIRKHASVASWLYGVAQRIALKSRRDRGRRQKLETNVPARGLSGTFDELSWREVKQVIYEELSKVTESYRSPLVLCYLEGKTQDEAAMLLGVSTPTVKKRLERGRALLRVRLERRNLGQLSLLAVASLPTAPALASVSASLMCSTVKAGVAIARGDSTALVCSAKVAALTKGTLNPMFLSKSKSAIAMVLLLSACIGAALALQPMLTGQVEAARKPETADDKKAVKEADTALKAMTVKVAGQIADQESGKGIADVLVLVNIFDGQDPLPSKQLEAETDKDGNFTAEGPPGWYNFWIVNPPDGYVLPTRTGSRKGWHDPVQLEVGKSHAFAPLALRKTATFSCQVMTAEGKPAAGAVVSLIDFAEPASRIAKKTADGDGKFAVKDLAPDASIFPRVQSGKAVNIPKEFELGKIKGQVAIEVSEANAAAFKGRAIDEDGKPFPNATVQLLLEVTDPVRQTFHDERIAAVNTDAEGCYSFAGFWPRDTYSVRVIAKGYVGGESESQVGEAGRVKTFADLTLVRAKPKPAKGGDVLESSDKPIAAPKPNSTVYSANGVVVGLDGKPIAGAEVFGMDGIDRLITTSAGDGTFNLNGFHDKATFVFARKADYRLAAVPIFPVESKPISISLVKSDGPPLPAPVIAPEHREAIDKLARHALRLVWENRAAFGEDDRRTMRDALVNMARIDLDIAKKWRDDEKKRSNGKMDFTRQINQVLRQNTLFTTARDDPDEAVAIINELDDEENGFAEVRRIGEEMLGVDKAKALRLAEAAVLKAREMELPYKAWALAVAGDLAARAGGAGGKKVLAEAAELAAKIPADKRDMNSYVVGFTSVHLACHDWPAAEILLNSVKDPSSYNRYLCAIVARLAATDLDLAKKLLPRFKPDNSYYAAEARPRMAFAIARDKPNEALKLVDGATVGRYRFLGYIQLAVLFAPTDKARAFKTMETAFDYLERDSKPFSRDSNFGGRAGLAAVAVVRAKEIGYPDTPTLVTRTLALMQNKEDTRLEKYDQRPVLKIAGALALVDPAVARHLLAGIAHPDELLKESASRRREWLIVLALADPHGAMLLTDKLIERAKNARDKESSSMLSELVKFAAILTAKDRLRAFTLDLPHEIEDE